MRSVLALTSNVETKRTAILFSRNKADGTKATGIGFLKWTSNISTGKPQMEVVKTGYFSSFTYNSVSGDDNSKLILLQKDRLHITINTPDETSFYDLFFILDSDYSKITKSYKEKYTTTNKSQALFGAPTRKIEMREGWDKDNVIMLSLITPARGMKALGDTTTLGNPRTYSVLTSRSFTITGKEPWTMKDRLYPWQQESTASFYRFKAMNTWFKTFKQDSSNTLVKDEGYIYNAGQHQQRDTELIVQVWELKKEHTLDRKYNRLFTGEKKTINVMGVSKVEGNDSPYNVYIFYTIP